MPYRSQSTFLNDISQGKSHFYKWDLTALAEIKLHWEYKSPSEVVVAPQEMI